MDAEGGTLLAPVDWLVIAAFAIGLITLGVLAWRAHAQAEDYFLASRAARWPAIGLALIASNISSTALIGLAGAGYAMGISVYNYEWTASVILVFFCLFLLPFVLSSRVYTMPEFLERRYDYRARLFFAVLTLFLNLFVDCAGALYSGSLVCRLLFPELPLWSLVVVLAVAAGLYTVLGGLRAVINTETVQAVLLFIGALTIAATAFDRAGGWRSVMQEVQPALLSLIRPIGDAGVPWPGLLFGIPVLGFYYWCTNQFIVQRVLAAQNLDHGRGGALFAGLLKLPVLFLMVMPGTCAILLYPNLERADMVYPKLMLDLLPPGLLGLVVASFIAATMASVASTLNSASTLMTLDVIKRTAPAISEEQVVRIGRISTAALLLVAVLWAPQITHFPSLWQYLQAVLAYVVPPIVALFLIGLFWRGANATGAAMTLLVGTVCGAGLFFATVVFQWWELHFLYAAPILLCIDSAVLVGVSLWTRRTEPAASHALIWTPQYFRAETERLRSAPFWRNYRVHAALLLVLTACIVIVFR